MPNLREVLGGTKTKIYCLATGCRTRGVAVHRTVKVGRWKSSKTTEVFRKKKLRKSGLLIRYVKIC